MRGSGMSLPPESASVVEKLISDYEVQRIDQRRLQKRLAVILSLPEEGSASSQSLLYRIKAKMVHLAAMDVVSDRACDIVVDLEEIAAQPASQIASPSPSSSVTGTPSKSFAFSTPPDGQVAVAGGSLAKSKKRTSGAFAPASGGCSSGGRGKKVSSSSSSSSELMDVEKDLREGEEGAKDSQRDQSPIRIASASPENQREPAVQPAAGHAVKHEKGAGVKQEEVDTSRLGIPRLGPPRAVQLGMVVSLLENPDEPLVVPASASSLEGMSAGKRAADREGSVDGQAGAGGVEKKKRKKSEARKVEAVQQSGPSVVFGMTAEERARPFHILDRCGSLANKAYRFFGKIVLKARRDDSTETMIHVKSPSFKRFCQAITTGELQAVGTTYSLASSLKEMQKLNMNPWRVEVAVLRVSDQPWRVNPGQEMTLVGDLYFYEKVWDISR